MQAQTKAAPGGDCYHQNQYQNKNCAERLDLALFDGIHGKFSFAAMKAARSLTRHTCKTIASAYLTLPQNPCCHIGQQRRLELTHLGEDKLWLT
jgi:hypothetical protein